MKLKMSENIRRFSSRRERLEHAFFAETQKNAKSYDRIAGYPCPLRPYQFSC